jgi:hypothetical protein
MVIIPRFYAAGMIRQYNKLKRIDNINVTVRDINTEEKKMSNRETREKLKKLKMEAANEIGMTQYVKENNDHYKGDVLSKINGAQGGPIGGQMVKKMIQAEESKLSGS